jgi:hypothetical protein
MTGLARRTGWSVRWSRTLIEIVVLAVGWFLGGSVGVGTVVYALAIGPLVQLLLPVFMVPATPRPESGAGGSSESRGSSESPAPEPLASTS